MNSVPSKKAFKETSAVEVVAIQGVAGGEAGGISARELDGSRLIILQFRGLRTGDLHGPYGLTLATARQLRHALGIALRHESKKSFNGTLPPCR